MYPIFDSLSNNYMDQVYNIVTNQISFRMTLVVLLILSIILTYLTFWMPVFNNVNTELNQTKNLIGIIPTEVFAREKRLMQILMQNIELNQRSGKVDE